MSIDYKAAKILVTVSPFLGAFIPSYLLFCNTQEYLSFGVGPAFLAALASESIGASAVSMYYKVKQHNAHYSADKNQVEPRIALVAYVIYIASALTVNAVLEIGHSGWAVITAKVFLSLFSLAGSLLLSIQYQIGEVQERLKRNRTGRKKTKPEPAEKSVETVRKVGKPTETPLPVFRVSKKEDLTAEMITELSNGHKPATLKKMFPDVTDRTIRNWKKEVQS